MKHVLTRLHKSYRAHSVTFVLTGLGLLLVGYGVVTRSTPAPVPPTTPPEVTETVATMTRTLPASKPISLRIPAASIEATFEDPLGLQPNNEIEVPEAYDTVGYYQYGPTPGELGPAVVLGHVDSYAGPGVFFSLGQAEVGDPVFIKRADGTEVEFVITRLERHEQAGFPTELVYGDIDHAGLRLITCSGTYDRSVERYTHNLIVFAELVGTSTAATP